MGALLQVLNHGSGTGLWRLLVDVLYIAEVGQ